MVTLQIPQSPMVTPDGKVTNEWLIFMNELVRTIDKLDKEKVGKIL